MRADKIDYTPDEKIRFFDTVLNLNILNKAEPMQLQPPGYPPFAPPPSALFGAPPPPPPGAPP